MRTPKTPFKILIYITTLLLLSSYSYAICKANPNTITISSGSNDLGAFKSGQTAYIDNNLAQSPLTVTLTFEGVEESCYDPADVTMRLFSSATPRPAQITSDGGKHLRNSHSNLHLQRPDPAQHRLHITHRRKDKRRTNLLPLLQL